MSKETYTHEQAEAPTTAGKTKAGELPAFFALTFLITFGGWYLARVTAPGSPGLGTLLEFIALWGPALAAILTTAFGRGLAGLGALFRSLFHARIPARWYLLIFLGWPALMILAAFLHAFLTRQAIQFQWGSWTNVSGWLIQAPLLGFWACEELGWRGFALPRLLQRWNALAASAILGVIWALWHLPYFLGFLGVDMGFPFYSFVIFTVSVSILMTWIFNHTGGSVFAATIFHFWINIYEALQADVLPLNDPGAQTMTNNWVTAAAALLVVILFGYRTFTGERKSKLAVEPQAPLS